MQFIASRINNNETTIAVVTCETKLSDPKLVTMAIKSAIANRAKTEDGRLAILESSNDFNFGDLAMEQENEGLMECLKSQHIENLEVNIINSSNSISFDTVLCPSYLDMEEQG